MKKTVFTALCPLLLCHSLLSPMPGECAAQQAVPKEEYAGVAEIEYGGKIISADIADLILRSDDNGGQTLELENPDKYAEQLEKAPVYGMPQNPAPPEIDPPGNAGAAYAANAPDAQEISGREYREEQTAREWADTAGDTALRKIDEKALELVKEYGRAEHAVPPAAGAAGSLVLSYAAYIPKIVCRPMYVTDIMLQPGEMVTGVHPGDPVRWAFVPGKSGAGDTEQVHVLIKPLMPDIATNVIITTDKRTYQLGLVASASDHIPSVSFSYPADTLASWNAFIERKKAERRGNAGVSPGYSVSPEDLHLDYEIRGKDTLRWKPVGVWDDGVKTYIRFRKGSVRKSVEAPVLIVFEHKKETLVNYRVAEDMYIADRVFDSGALITGTGPHQDRVVIKRLKAR